MVLFNQFIKSLIGIVAHKTASKTTGFIVRRTNSFIEGLNLYRCQYCYRLYKDDPLECRCGNTRLEKIHKKKRKYGRQKTRTAFRERYGIDD